MSGITRIGVCAGPGDEGAPARILAGSPATRLWNEYADRTGRFFSGVWSSTAGSWSVDYTEEEMCVIIEGRARLTAEDGTESEFGPGDAFVIPSGFKGTWTTLEPVKKFYAIFEPPG